MKLPNLEYDYVISSYAFYYSKDSLKVLSLIYEKIKPGGTFFICGPAYTNNLGIKNFLKK